MKALFTPAIKLMNRLKYPQKFLLIGLLLLLPLLLVLTKFIQQSSRNIEFSTKEQVGLAYNAPLVTFLRDVQQHWGMSNAYLGGDTSFKDSLVSKEADIEADIQVMDSVDSQLAASLGVTNSWQTVKAAWQTVKPKTFKDTFLQSFDEHQMLNDQILTLITQVANASNLIVDPDLDTSYLMDVLVVKIPKESEYLSQVRGHGLMVTASKSMSGEDRTSISIHAGLARTTHAEIQQDFVYVFHANPSLKSRLEAPLAASNDAITYLFNFIAKNMLGTSPDNV